MFYAGVYFWTISEWYNGILTRWKNISLLVCDGFFFMTFLNIIVSEQTKKLT